MKKVTETELPGVGIRLDLDTDSGRPVGVVIHQTGRRDLVVYDDQDPDRASETVELTEDEGHTLAEMLGGSRVHEHLEDAQHQIEDLVISWITIDPTSSLAGRTLSEAALRKQTGAGIVALVAETGSVPVPGGDQVLEPGATAVLVGLPDAVEVATALLAPTTAQP